MVNVDDKIQIFSNLVPERTITRCMPACFVYLFLFVWHFLSSIQHPFEDQMKKSFMVNICLKSCTEEPQPGQSRQLFSISSTNQPAIAEGFVTYLCVYTLQTSFKGNFFFIFPHGKWNTSHTGLIHNPFLLLSTEASNSCLDHVMTSLAVPRATRPKEVSSQTSDQKRV